MLGRSHGSAAQTIPSGAQELHGEPCANVAAARSGYRLASRAWLEAELAIRRRPELSCEPGALGVERWASSSGFGRNFASARPSDGCSPTCSTARMRSSRSPTSKSGGAPHRPVAAPVAPAAAGRPSGPDPCVAGAGAGAAEHRARQRDRPGAGPGRHAGRSLRPCTMRCSSRWRRSIGRSMHAMRCRPAARRRSRRARSRATSLRWKCATPARAWRPT